MLRRATTAAWSAGAGVRELGSSSIEGNGVAATISTAGMRAPPWAASNWPPTPSPTAPAASPSTTTRCPPFSEPKPPPCWSPRSAYPTTDPVPANAPPTWTGYGSSSPEPATVDQTTPPAGLELSADTSAPTAHPMHTPSIEHCGDNHGDHRSPVLVREEKHPRLDRPPHERSGADTNLPRGRVRDDAPPGEGWPQVPRHPLGPIGWSSRAGGAGGLGLPSPTAAHGRVAVSRCHGFPS
jgi:hypothetical protein